MEGSLGRISDDRMARMKQIDNRGNREKVAAVVIGYNRKELLGECLDALLAQTYSLDSIILIDNASTDGTPEFLGERGYLANPQIDYVRSPGNTGSSGGFYEGAKRGYEKGFSWIWIMDDDVIFRKDALEKMMEKIGGSKNLVVVPRVKNSDEEAGVPAPIFAGGLFPREIFSKVGFPRKEFFLYNDDSEFVMRMGENDLSAEVTDAFCKHAQHKFKALPFFGKKVMFWDIPDWKYYYIVRNDIAMHIIHRHYLRLLERFIVWEIKVFVLLLNKEWEIAKAMQKGILDGFFLKMGKRF